VFGGTAHGGAELIGFDLAESRLAEAFRRSPGFSGQQILQCVHRDRQSASELTREERADGGLAGSP